MRRFVYILLFIATVQLFNSCGRPAPREDEPCPVKVDVKLTTTPVKNQGKQSSCWIYAYLACVETERIEQYGDSLNLSPIWLLENMFREQAVERYISQGSTSISVRGVGPDAEALMQKYGMVPWSNFKPSEDLNAAVLERNLSNRINTAIRSQKGISAVLKVADECLPPVPHNLKDGFYLYSMHYTPMEFGMSILSGVHFKWITSYTHHPYHQSFVLEVADNRHHLPFMNVTPEEMLRLTYSSIRNHHPVYWEGGMERRKLKSVHVYSPYNISPSVIGKIAQERQKAFESFSVTDQHAMAIVGLAHDAKGNVYFILKNSWGTDWGYKGYEFMTVDDFLMNTIFVGIIDIERK